MRERGGVAMYRALYSFRSAEPNSLPFAAGETFLLLERSNQHWWLVTRAGSGETGYAPASYLQRLQVGSGRGTGGGNRGGVHRDGHRDGHRERHREQDGHRERHRERPGLAAAPGTAPGTGPTGTGTGTGTHRVWNRHHHGERLRAPGPTVGTSPR